MAVIINELEIVTEPESASPRDPGRPAGEPPRGQPRPPDVEDLLDLARWADERALRLRSY